MTDLLVAEIQKNKAETIHVAVREFRGNVMIDSRVYVTGPDGELRPTAKGLAIRPALATELAHALIEAAAAAQGSGRHSADDEDWAAPPERRAVR